MKDILDKIKTALGSVLSDADKATIKEYQTKLAEAVAPAETPAETPNPVNKVKTKEGLEIIIEGEVGNGAAVFVSKSETEKEPAPDGAYTLEDGTVLVVTGGLVTEVKKAEAAPAENPADAEMKAKMDAMQADLASSKNEISELKKMLGFTLSKLDEFAQVPVNTEEVVEAKSWDEMSTLEKRRALKGN